MPYCNANMALHVCVCVHAGTEEANDAWRMMHTGESASAHQPLLLDLCLVLLMKLSRPDSAADVRDDGALLSCSSSSSALAAQSSSPLPYLPLRSSFPMVHTCTAARTLRQGRQGRPASACRTYA